MSIYWFLVLLYQWSWIWWTCCTCCRIILQVFQPSSLLIFPWSTWIQQDHLFRCCADIYKKWQSGTHCPCLLEPWDHWSCHTWFQDLSHNIRFSIPCSPQGRPESLYGKTMNSFTVDLTISDIFLSSSSIVYCLLGRSWRHPFIFHEISPMIYDLDPDLFFTQNSVRYHTLMFIL